MTTPHEVLIDLAHRPWGPDGPDAREGYLSLVAVRVDLVPDAWNDVLIAFIGESPAVRKGDRRPSRHRSVLWDRFTTKPGAVSLGTTTLVGADGVGIIAPTWTEAEGALHGPLRYQVGFHRPKDYGNTRPCLRADDGVPIYRDGDRDGRFDLRGPLTVGKGFNIHDTGGADARHGVGAWSLGCLVHGRYLHHNNMMVAAREHEASGYGYIPVHLIHGPEVA